MQRDNLIELAERHQVQNEIDADAANTILTKITAGLREIEKKRKSFTAPLNQSLKQINDTFREIKEPIEQAKRNLSQRLMAWRTTERERIEAQRRQAEEEARKRDEKREKLQNYHESVGHDTTVLEPTSVQEPIPFEAKDTTKVRVNYDVKVINKQLVPEEYKMVDLARIRQLMFAAARNESNEPIFNMPGIEVFTKEIPVYG